tara:strand:- start:67 stop:390 length:324 start_codon:yes stop_codon:yes gene_type:complete
MNCGSDIIHDSCVGAMITMDDSGFKIMFGEIVSTATFLISVTLAMGSSDLPLNMVKGLNALRCAFLAGYINLWMLVGSAYYFLRFFFLGFLVEDLISSVYPRICTCT